MGQKRAVEPENRKTLDLRSPGPPPARPERAFLRPASTDAWESGPGAQRNPTRSTDARKPVAGSTSARSRPFALEGTWQCQKPRKPFKTNGLRKSHRQRTSPPAPSGLFCAHFVSIDYKHTIS